MAADTASSLPIGPQAGVSYPIRVDYCGECTLPVEYCEYGPCPEKCKEWLQVNLSKLYKAMYVKSDEADGNESEKKSEEAEGGDGASTDDKKRQKRGGKGAPKAPKKAAAAAGQKITVSRAPRGKNKFVTVVGGLQTYDIELKAAAKFFAQRFACGSSVTGPDEIVIQGDVKDDLFDVLPEKWAQIDEDNIDDLGDLKR